MSNDYKKLPFFKDVEVADDAEMKKPKLTFKAMLKVVLIWACLFSMSVWMACFMWTFAHSFTHRNVTLEKPLMDENCFVTYLIGFEVIFESPEYFEKKTEKKLEDYTTFKQFAHHQSLRNQYYFIDPLYFLGYLFIVTSIIEIYHLFCCCIYKKNAFTSRFLACFHIYSCTLFAIFAFDAFIYFKQLDDEKFIENCKFQFLNY